MLVSEFKKIHFAVPPSVADDSQQMRGIWNPGLSDWVFIIVHSLPSARHGGKRCGGGRMFPAFKVNNLLRSHMTDGSEGLKLRVRDGGLAFHPCSTVTQCIASSHRGY